MPRHKRIVLPGRSLIIMPTCHRLQAEGLLSIEEVSQLEAKVAEEVKAAVEFARQSRRPDPMEAFEDLWA